MIELRTLNAGAVPAALEMAKSYRLLNEPEEAESICLDILAVSPGHQEALTTLLLARTDKFAHGELNPAFDDAKAIVEQLDSQYCKSYYAGIIFERRAKHHLKRGGPGAGAVAYEWFVKALNAFGKALDSCDPSNQDAVLRWNSCARFINDNPDLKPGEADQAEMLMDSFETPH